MSEKSRSEKVAVVTGASSGIGQATAVELARRGYHVAIHYFANEKGARETYEKVRALKAGHARVYSCDVSDHVQAGQMAGDVLADFTRIDVLVNNAGSLVERRLFADMDRDLWRRVLALNLDSVYYVTHAFLPAMIRQGSGCVVNVASIAGRNGGGLGASAYAAAKGAVITLTKSLARELVGHGIRVNCVNPGVIDTPFHERFSTREMLDRLIAGIPAGRVGSAAEVARAIAFLASDEASYVVGECVEINGGQLMD
jgi:3-oxoacyl-[acyl-carrier protein] reductase